MWHETSKSITSSPYLDESIVNAPHPALIEAVEPHSIGEELGIEPGDRLLSINNLKPRDLIDYKYLISDEELIIFNIPPPVFKIFCPSLTI